MVAVCESYMIVIMICQCFYLLFCQLAQRLNSLVEFRLCHYQITFNWIFLFILSFPFLFGQSI